MKKIKHLINRISSYIYFKTMSEYTLRKSVQKQEENLTPAEKDHHYYKKLPLK